jgi:hypothetical protein
MLEPVRPGPVSSDRALCIPTFSRFLIVNKTFLSISHSLTHSLSHSLMHSLFHTLSRSLSLSLAPSRSLSLSHPPPPFPRPLPPPPRLSHYLFLSLAVSCSLSSRTIGIGEHVDSGGVLFHKALQVFRELLIGTEDLQFSKVSALVHSLYQATIEQTFENIRTVMLCFLMFSYSRSNSSFNCRSSS